MGGKAMKKNWSASNIEKQLRSMKVKPKGSKRLGNVFGGEADEKD